MGQRWPRSRSSRSAAVARRAASATVPTMNSSGKASARRSTSGRSVPLGHRRAHRLEPPVRPPREEQRHRLPGQPGERQAGPPGPPDAEGARAGTGHHGQQHEPDGEADRGAAGAVGRRPRRRAPTRGRRPGRGARPRRSRAAAPSTAASSDSSSALAPIAPGPTPRTASIVTSSRRRSTQYAPAAPTSSKAVMIPAMPDGLDRVAHVRRRASSCARPRTGARSGPPRGAGAARRRRRGGPRRGRAAPRRRRRGGRRRRPW